MRVALIDDARLLGDLVAAHLLKLGHQVERVAPGKVFRAFVLGRTRWSACVVAVDSARLAPVLRLVRCVDRTAPIVAVVPRNSPIPAATVARSAPLITLSPPIETDALRAALASAAGEPDTADESARRAPDAIRWHRRPRPTPEPSEPTPDKQS